VKERATPLTLDEAAEYLNVTPRFIRRLMYERRIPYYKLGRLVRFSSADLDNLLDTARVDPIGSGNGSFRRVVRVPTRRSVAGRRASSRDAVSVHEEGGTAK
jgi:excisionase family DNA binding protein